MTGAPVLAATDITFGYGGDAVLRGVTLDVGPGEFVALAGPNGSGKSTLLRILLGLRAPEEGTVQLFGHAPAALTERWRLGYVPQRAVVPEHLPATVEEVVAAGCLSRRGWRRGLTAADRVDVAHALESVRLTERAGDPLRELSGGQQQRVLIAKALVSRPDLLVLDEPVAGVDTESQGQFRDALVHLVEEHGSGVLLVSHELGAVAADLDRVLVLRQGRIVFDGPPADLESRGVHLGIHRDDLPLWLEG
ncbi:MAG TPA: metal ABC transporter ATP-binding protein [Acidimicrobiales bacterium]|nr:metal ABC transporter ATP-binding protein [Acidimicrobiales bacterium]